MLEKFIKKVVEYWVAKEIINGDDSDIYEYGLDLILYSIINIVVIIISAVFVDRLIESIILLTFIIPMQSCGGGYHAKTHWRCFIIMYIGWWLIMWIIPDITLLSGTLIICASLVTIFVLAPVRHENVPISDAQFLKMKVLIRCFSVVTALAGITISWFMGIGNRIGSSITMAMSAVAVSMLVAKIRSNY